MKEETNNDLQLTDFEGPSHIAFTSSESSSIDELLSHLSHL